MSVRKPDKSESVVFAWLGGAILLIATLPIFAEKFWVFGLVPSLGWLGLGLILLIVLLVMRHWRAAALLGILTCLVLFLAGPINGLGARAWYAFSFNQNKATYDQIVASAGRLPDVGVYGSVEYQISRGLNTRVAFPRPGGDLFEWDAVVHDPSGLLSRKGFSREAPLPDELSRAFGGRLLQCQLIADDYHRCTIEGAPASTTAAPL